MEFSTKQLKNLIITKYGLKDSIDNRDAIYRGLKRICKGIKVKDPMNGYKETSLWEYTQFTIDGKKHHKFTEWDIERIFGDLKFKKFIITRVKDDMELTKVTNKNKYEELSKVLERLKAEYEHEKKLKKEAEELNYLADTDNAQPPEWFKRTDVDFIKESGIYNYDDVKLKKMEIMIEALFLKYFTPIDEEQLLFDMNYVAGRDYFAGDITPDDLKIKERYEKNDYYTERIKKEK